MKKIIQTDKAPSPVGPYNQAVQVDNTIYLSGQIAIDPSTGQLIMDSIENETHQVMKNIHAVLSAAGSSFDQVVKCTIFMADMNDYSRINDVYSSYFDDQNAPAREAVEVSRLPKDVHVEISCTAIA